MAWPVQDVLDSVPAPRAAPRLVSRFTPYILGCARTVGQCCTHIKHGAICVHDTFNISHWVKQQKPFLLPKFAFLLCLLFAWAQFAAPLGTYHVPITKKADGRRSPCLLLVYVSGAGIPSVLAASQINPLKCGQKMMNSFLHAAWYPFVNPKDNWEGGGGGHENTVCANRQNSCIGHRMV